MFGAVKKTGPPVFTNSGKNRRALNEGKGSNLSETPPGKIPESGKSPSEKKHQARDMKEGLGFRDNDRTNQVDPPSRGMRGGFRSDFRNNNAAKN